MNTGIISTRIASALTVIMMFSSAAGAQTSSQSTVDVGVSTTIIQPLTISKGADLSFGRIVKPTTGSGTVSMSASSDVVAAGAGAVALGGINTSRAKFAIAGEGGQAISLTVPASVQLTHGSDAIAVTLTPDLTATPTLSGALGTQGGLALNIGGSFTIPNTASTGNYSGRFNVTVSYN